ncbi:MAG TPA: M48 family peptidase [Alphaproteobacteria bacterium]|nr:M48 family peptidase [Alphaproteobacteria bacterium]
MARIGKDNDALRRLDLAGRPVAVRFRRNRRARRLIVRVDPGIDGLSVTLPPGAGQGEGLDLIRRRQSWVLGCLDAVAPRVPFAAGAHVPFLGHDHLIRHEQGRGVPVWRALNIITVTGRAEHLARRLNDWFRQQARDEITPRIGRKAAVLGPTGRRAGRVSIRDTRSRWGSYSVNGGFSFSWRLVLAPEFVLDYVVAHEVAHMKVMNHGAEFWAVVAGLTDDVQGARDWLKLHGDAIHRYG